MKNWLDPIIQGQLDTIQKEGLRNNEQELNLPENTQIYAGLYENGISKEELARKIIDQWNISDGKDYFSNPEQSKKANSYANFIISEEGNKEHKADMTEATKKADEEKAIKMDDLMNSLEDKPENIEKGTETIVESAKKRIMQTIDRYTNKIKDIQVANETEKERLNKELADIKTELKAEKNNYEKIKKNFFAKDTNKFENFSEKDLENVPTGLIRYEQRQGKLFNSPKKNKMDTIRRNRTIHTLIKKFNKIGDGTKNWGKDWVRFIMGFEKARFLRYTGIKVNSAIDKAWSAMGMQMDPQQFHTMFNAWRNNIFAILDIKTSNENNDQEVAAIKAIKARINYYGALYARERANARVTPFVEAEKTAKEDEKILETPKTIELNSKQETTTQAA